MTDAPRISREEAIKHIHDMHGSTFMPSEGYITRTREYLAAFLAARVPDAVAPGVVVFLNEDDMMPGHEQPAWKRGFNACRDIVLRGKG